MVHDRLIMSFHPVQLKTHHVEELKHVKSGIAQSSPVNMVVRRMRCQLRCRPRLLTEKFKANVSVGKLSIESARWLRCSVPTSNAQGCGFDLGSVAAVAAWYRHRIVAGFVTSSSPVPLKTRRVGQRCTLNLSRAETSSRWCGVVVRRGGASSGVVHVT
ncbi:uncharacterized protein TNCV_3503571 [Trichonephila clavipes]|uniref:Uncharacterized protein n=1 Tax=Trichonephila clavipes TaxID=2585209 RepID=A0A8X6RYF7_TRICX|nr:uncharacterized protein TNCV_3503571 [Trichonephila clavipes]